MRIMLYASKYLSRWFKCFNDVEALGSANINRKYIS